MKRSGKPSEVIGRMGVSGSIVTLSDSSHVIYPPFDCDCHPHVLEKADLLIKPALSGGTQSVTKKRKKVKEVTESWVVVHESTFPTIYGPFKSRLAATRARNKYLGKTDSIVKLRDFNA